MQTIKEKTGNATASAKAGMEKAKASAQEKVDKMRAHDETEKAIAEQRKVERKEEAEANKQITKEENAEARAARKTGEHHATGGYGTGSTIERSPVVGERVVSGNTPAGHETGGRI